MSIDDLISDWGGFERLVASLHDTGAVTVEHNVVVRGRSGANRQIDVLIRHKQGLYEHLVVIECKYWNSRVERLHVDALTTTIREVGASRGVIFSTKGFQSGAVDQAKHENIELYVVRDLTNEEWGLPGRIVDLFLHVAQPSLGNISTPDARLLSQNVERIGVPIAMNLGFGIDAPTTYTPILNKDGVTSDMSIEQQILQISKNVFIQSTSNLAVLNDGSDCSIYTVRYVSFSPKEPMMVRIARGILVIPVVTFDLGLHITQSRITVDRGKQLQFALAVDNFITGRVSAASRNLEASETKLQDVQTAPSGQTLVNGSIMRIGVKGFFPFDELKESSLVPFYTLKHWPNPSGTTGCPSYPESIGDNPTS
jgi:Restriction endonuclease